MRAGFLVALDLIILDKWDNLVENNSLIKYCYDESNELNNNLLNQHQVHAKEWLAANKLDTPFSGDYIHEAKSPEKIGYGMPASELFEFCKLMKELLIIESFDICIKKISFIYDKYKDDPTVGVQIRRLFQDPYWLKLNYKALSDQNPSTIVFKLILNHSNYIETLHANQYMQAMNKSIPPLDAIMLFIKMMRNNKKRYLEMNGKNNKKYGYKNNTRDTNVHTYWRRKRKVIRSPANGGNIELVRDYNLLKKGLQCFQFDKKYNPKGKTSLIKLWICKTASIQCNGVSIINYFIPGLVSKGAGGPLLKEEKNSWLIKSLTVAVIMNKNVNKCKELSQICMDKIYGTTCSSNYADDKWKQLLRFVFELKNKGSHEDILFKIFKRHNDLNTFDYNNFEE
eukprot:398434_1